MTDYSRDFPLSVAPRPLRFEGDRADVVALVREELPRIGRRYSQALDRLWVAIGQAAFHLRRLEEDLEREQPGAPFASETVAIIARQLEQVLEQDAVRLEDLTGQPWSARMTSHVELRGYQVREDLAGPTIVYMELPVIYHRDRLIAKGAVLVETPSRDGGGFRDEGTPRGPV